MKNLNEKALFLLGMLSLIFGMLFLGFGLFLCFYLFDAGAAELPVWITDLYPVLHIAHEIMPLWEKIAVIATFIMGGLMLFALSATINKLYYKEARADAKDTGKILNDENFAAEPQTHSGSKISPLLIITAGILVILGLVELITYLLAVGIVTAY